MLYLYNPATQANQTTSGQVSAELLLLNILIELRVANEIAAGGTATQSVDQYRSDVVNQTP